uniref:DUF4283 domain-containing protein n=1 Tax=Angiostrongylus cantonensis TaxID=6313 RepID=A0A0K0DEH4_ANGCA
MFSSRWKNNCDVRGEMVITSGRRFNCHTERAVERPSQGRRKAVGGLSKDHMWPVVGCNKELGYYMRDLWDDGRDQCRLSHMHYIDRLAFSFSNTE